MMARALFGASMPQYLNAITIATNQAIADTGATSIFIMEGADVANKRIAVKPLTINLPDGNQIQSTHECDIQIFGLPTILMGHIVPLLSAASLIRIRPLCKAGCTVVFDDKKCNVMYNIMVILRGFKDPSTDLWTLPIPKTVCTTPEPTVLPQSGPCIDCAPHLQLKAGHNHLAITVALFTHSVCTCSNAVKFAHQSLCNLKISTLLKAVQKGFLKGCPNMTETLILKYLNASPATTKGHMKRPQHGIHSTRPKPAAKGRPNAIPGPVAQIAPPVLPLFNAIPVYPGPGLAAQPGPNIFVEDDDDLTAHIFCFGAFANKNSGIVYHDLTGSFPFMLFDGSVCFFVLYHYKSNTILATPIAGLDDVSIFHAYKKYFEGLTAKGFKPKLNVMNNQATKHIKNILTKDNCKLQVLKPHNHWVNATERAIQTFKAAFTAALATTDSNFPLQLWDKLTPQVQDTLNLLRALRVDPTKSAYEILNSPYDWNRYPLAPLGCKAVVYEDSDTRGLWASRGVDAFYLGPAMDHYRCDHYYIPDTQAYRISGSSKLFPQHCQLPPLTPHQHLRALTKELTDNTELASETPKGWRLLRLLATQIDGLLTPPPTREQQRVTEGKQRKEEQRVIDESPIITIPCITDAPPIMQAQNPTVKRKLKTTPCLHCQVTCNNTLGILPDQCVIEPIPIIEPTNPRRGKRAAVPTRVQPPRGRLLTRMAVPSGACQHVITRHAINILTLCEQASFSTIHTLCSLMRHGKVPINYKHYTNPMVHPVTGRTISSYKKLMHDLAMAEVWQTAFGKHFGGMAQGCNKTGQKGTNAMFMMTHDEIRHALLAKKQFTYVNPIVDCRPQKEDPHRIQITAGGN
jgi:hypothetical protein